MTPCDLPLQGTDINGNVRDAWFIPQKEQQGEYESDAFLIVNGAGGYRYQPEGSSPVIRPVHDFWISVSPGEWICGPQLTHKKDNLKLLLNRGSPRRASRRIAFLMAICSSRKARSSILPNLVRGSSVVRVHGRT